MADSSLQRARLDDQLLMRPNHINALDAAVVAAVSREDTVALRAIYERAIHGGPAFSAARAHLAMRDDTAGRVGVAQSTGTKWR